MRRWYRSAALLAVLAAPLAFQRLAAQGITTAAVAGRFTDEAGSPVPQASISLVNRSTGQSYATRSAEDGRFSFENVLVGGPYTIDVRAIGFEPLHFEGLQLRLGQRFVFDRPLRRSAVEVSGVSFEAGANPLLSVARTGAQTFVGESLITRLPTLGRNFTDFISAVPQVVTSEVPGASVGGCA